MGARLEATVRGLDAVIGEGALQPGPGGEPPRHLDQRRLADVGGGDGVLTR